MAEDSWIPIAIFVVEFLAALASLAALLLASRANRLAAEALRFSRDVDTRALARESARLIQAWWVHWPEADGATHFGLFLLNPPDTPDVAYDVKVSASLLRSEGHVEKLAPLGCATLPPGMFVAENVRRTDGTFEWRAPRPVGSITEYRPTTVSPRQRIDRITFRTRFGERWEWTHSTGFQPVETPQHAENGGDGRRVTAA